MIDDNFRPWLLEVNHTPSFTTDTPLDRTIKKNVILDSLRLMNITYENRMKCKEKIYKDVEKRSLEGRKCNLTPQEKQELKEKAQFERDAHEDEHLGGFDKVYPISQDHEDMYEHLIKFAEKQYSEWTGTSNPFIFIPRHHSKHKAFILRASRRKPRFSSNLKALKDRGITKDLLGNKVKAEASKEASSEDKVSV